MDESSQSRAATVSVTVVTSTQSLPLSSVSYVVPGCTPASAYERRKNSAVME
jgi:hypothetical protein